MSDDNKPTLTYFDMRGRAEAIRLFFVDQGIPFMDRRIRSADAWQALKSTLPLGCLPLYSDPLVQLTQSHAISRYLARSTGLVPLDAVGSAPYDQAHEALAEAQEQLWQFAWHEDYGSAPEQFASGQLTRTLRSLERLYEANEGVPWVGGAPSHVDYLAFCYVDELRAFFPDTLAEFAALVAFHAELSRRPRIQAYVGSGRRAPVFGMGLSGPKVDPDSVIEPGSVFENPWTKPIPLRAAEAAD